MSRTKRLYCVLVVISVFLSGCYSAEITIYLNPDGSGIITEAINFDRATEEQRQQIRQMFKSPNVTRTPWEKRELDKVLPRPYFEVIEEKEDLEGLKFYSKATFTDINRLLVKETQSNCHIGGLDFRIEGDEIIFAIKNDENETAGTFPKKMEGAPPTRLIRIVNARTDEKIEFFEEYEPDYKPVEWTGRLSMPGHTIKREVIKYNFADYPVLKITEVKVREAEWCLNKGEGRRGLRSYLDVELEADIPKDNFTYVKWFEPILLSGFYQPQTPLELTEHCQGESEEFAKESKDVPEGYFCLPLELIKPPQPVKTIASMTIRIRALRSAKTSRLKMGTVEPNTEYKVGDFDLKTDDLKDHRLGLEVEGPMARIKGVLLESKRGNIFPLKKSSWSGLEDSGTLRFWPFLPLDEAVVYLDVYDDVENCWLDVYVPEFNLTPRWPGLDREEVNQGKDWVVQLKGKMPEVFNQNILQLTSEVFTDKEKFESFLSNLPDELILPALIQVAVHPAMGRHEQNWEWYQISCQKEIAKRENFYEAEKENIASTLFMLFDSLPEDLAGNIDVLFYNLQLAPYVRAKALERLQAGQLRFASEYFFRDEFSDEEHKVLKEVFYQADDKGTAGDIFRLLMDVKKPDLALAREVLQDTSQDELVRMQALHALTGQSETFPAKIVMPYAHDTIMQRWVLQALKNWLYNYGYRAEDKKQNLEELQAAAKPLIPLLEDLAEQVDEYKRKEAFEILTMIQTGKLPEKE